MARDTMNRSTSTDPQRRGSLLEGGLWMLVLAIVLSWLPLFGPLIAGGVGGRIVGERKRALFVALVPAIALAVLIWIVLALFELPVLGAVVGVGILGVIAFQEIPLLIGAYAGGALAGD